MQLSKVIETDLKSIGEEATLGDLIQVISTSKRNIYPVLTEEGYLVGVVLLDDIREIMFNSEMYDTPISNLMNMPPASIRKDDPMEEVLKKFRDTGAWNLPVIDEGKYVGFVTPIEEIGTDPYRLNNYTETLALNMATTYAEQKRLQRPISQNLRNDLLEQTLSLRPAENDLLVSQDRVEHVLDRAPNLSRPGDVHRRIQFRDQFVLDARLEIHIGVAGRRRPASHLHLAHLLSGLLLRTRFFLLFDSPQ